MARAVFLDRDGVLNDLVYYADTGEHESPRTAADLQVFPYVFEELKRLQEAGWMLFVVSNQPSYAKGKCTLEDLHGVEAALEQALVQRGIHIQAFYYDYTHPQAVLPGYRHESPTRKPAPGFLHQAARDCGVDLAQSWMIGDRDTDIQCGQAAGCFTALLTGSADAAKRGHSRPDIASDRFTDIVMTLLKRERQTSMTTLADLKIKLYADGADIASMQKLYQLPYIQGFTTNPTLMNKAGITDYAAFAHEVLKAIPDRSVSFEVFSDDFEDMERQARLIATWGENVYVKIPVTNTKGESATPLIRKLTDAGVKLNVTAVFTLEQTRAVAEALHNGAPAILSIFAGRIADAGIDPVPLMAEALKMIAPMPNIELLWASPREVFNVVQANDIGCHIITATPDILGKLKSLGKDLTEFSLDTVKMFYNDATAAGFKL